MKGNDGRDQFYFTPEVSATRQEAYDLALKMCFDEELPYRSGHILIQALVDLFPECYDAGLGFWMDKFVRLGQCDNINEIVEIMREWIFTPDGNRFSDSSEQVVIMSAIILINAIRNRLWTCLDKKRIIAKGLRDKHTLMRTILVYLCAQHGTTIMDLMGDVPRKKRQRE